MGAARGRERDGLPHHKRSVATAPLSLLTAALAFAGRAPALRLRSTHSILAKMSASNGGSAEKRSAESIDLGSTDEDEPETPSKAARTTAAAASMASSAAAAAAASSSTTTVTVPAGASTLRAVKVPPGWSVHGGSLLVKSYGALTSSTKIAAFDFDGCLARTPLGGNDPNAWSMQYKHVPSVLASLHASGHAIVIVTNESMDRLKKEEAIRNNILKKCGRLDGFAKACAPTPILCLCATAKDSYRKPETGAWSFFTSQCNGGVVPEVAKSFFVGDAAGRPGDHSDSDRVFAEQCKLPFHDEKEFFERMHKP